MGFEDAINCCVNSGSLLGQCLPIRLLIPVLLRLPSVYRCCLALVLVWLLKEIIAIAQTYKAGSIVLPKLGDMREIVQSQIQAIAEAKCPGSVEVQQKYAKHYRVNVHSWSYGRLIQSIQSKAAKIGIMIETGKQLTTATIICHR